MPITVDRNSDWLGGNQFEVEFGACSLVDVFWPKKQNWYLQRLHLEGFVEVHLVEGYVTVDGSLGNRVHQLGEWKVRLKSKSS